MKKNDDTIKRQRSQIDDILDEFHMALYINHPCTPIEVLEAEFNEIRNQVHRDNDEYFGRILKYNIKPYEPKK